MKIPNAYSAPERLSAWLEITNTYAYVNGNPINAIDPFGLLCLSAGEINGYSGVVGGAVAGALSSRGRPRVAVALGGIGAVVGGLYGYGSGGSSGWQGVAVAGGMAAAGAGPGSMFGVGIAGALGQAMADEMGGGPGANIAGAGVGGAGASGVEIFLTTAGRLTTSMMRQRISQGAGAAMAAAAAQEATKAYLEANNDCGCGK